MIHYLSGSVLVFDFIISSSLKIDSICDSITFVSALLLLSLFCILYVRICREVACRTGFVPGYYFAA